MKYINFLVVIVLGSVIKLLTPVIYWIVYNYREKARYVVYSYSVANKLDIYDIDKYKMSYQTPTHTGTIKYILYKWFIWIWLNDRVSHDTIDNKIVLDFILAHNLSKNKFIKGVVNKLNSLPLSKETELVPFINGCGKYTHYITHFYGQLITVLNTSDTNYDYFYYLTNVEDKTFLFNIFGFKIGWVPCEDTSNGIWYKMIIGKPIVKEMN